MYKNQISNLTKEKHDNSEFEENKKYQVFIYYIEDCGKIFHLMNLNNFKKYKFSFNQNGIEYDSIEQHKNFLFLSNRGIQLNRKSVV